MGRVVVGLRREAELLQQIALETGPRPEGTIVAGAKLGGVLLLFVDLVFANGRVDVPVVGREGIGVVDNRAVDVQLAAGERRLQAGGGAQIVGRAVGLLGGGEEDGAGRIGADARAIAGAVVELLVEEE